MLFMKQVVQKNYGIQESTLQSFLKYFYNKIVLGAQSWASINAP